MLTRLLKPTPEPKPHQVTTPDFDRKAKEMLALMKGELFGTADDAQLYQKLFQEGMEPKDATVLLWDMFRTGLIRRCGEFTLWMTPEGEKFLAEGI